MTQDLSLVIVGHKAAAPSQTHVSRARYPVHVCTLHMSVSSQLAALVVTINTEPKARPSLTHFYLFQLFLFSCPPSRLFLLFSSAPGIGLNKGFSLSTLAFCC